MKEIFRSNNQLILISLIWLVVGMYAGPVIYVLLPLMLLLMYRKEMHLEILLGFFFILTLSDSRSYQLSFAGNVKNIYIILLFLFTLKEYKNLEKQISFFKNFIPFFIIAFICLIFSPSPFSSFQKTVSYLLLLIAVPNYFMLVYQKYGGQLYKSLVFLVCCFLALGLILDLFTLPITDFAGRYRGVLGNPNGLALYVFLFIITFFVIIHYYSDLFSRNEKLIVFGLLFFSLLKTGARTSLIATLLFLFFRKFYKISPWLGFIIFLVVLSIYQLVSSNTVEIISALGLGNLMRVETLANGSGRLVAWTFAWQQIELNFFIGRGFNYTEYIYRKYADYLSLLGHQGHAHNIYLTLWLDTGLVGLIFYLVGLLISFLKAAKISNMAIPFLYALILSCTYESWLTSSLNPLTIQMLFILTIIFINEDKTSYQTNLTEAKA